jgi:hypothetical protein
MIIMNGKTQIKEKKNLAYKNERHTRYQDICDHWWDWERQPKTKILSKSCSSNLDSIVNECDIAIFNFNL